MPVEDVLVHTATPRDVVETGAWIEGERDVERQLGQPFACCLFPEFGAEDPGGERERQQRRATLLYVPTDPDTGLAVHVGPNDELLVRADELADWMGGSPARWQVEGTPQPAGPPGEEPAVVQARLVAIGD